MDSQSLQRFYFIAAAAIVFALVLLRIIVLRRRNQAFSDFFRVGRSSQYSYGSYPPHDSGYGSMYHGIRLAPLPAVYRPDQRIRAEDVDAHGRRLGPEAWNGKDALPAYDNLDRPPKYLEAGLSPGALQYTGQSAATPSPEGEQSGMGHPNTTNRVPGDNVDQPSNDAHAVPGRSEVLLPPPAHHNLYGS